MPTITFTLTSAVATELTAAAQKRGFANAKDWVRNLIRQDLINLGAEGAQGKIALILTDLEDSAKAIVNSIT